MSIISGSIPNFINGVSQQPFAIRLASQAEEQVNGYSSVVSGLTKRPPTKHVARIVGSAPGKAEVHIINRDPKERYVVLMTDGDLKVFDFEGREKTVNFPNGKDYLKSATCNYTAVTVADYTFVCNKDKVVAMNEEKAPERAFEAIIYVRQGNYQTDYRIVVDDSWVCAVTTALTDGNQIKTEWITQQLYDKLKANTDFSCEWRGSALLLKRKNGNKFTIRTEDTLGDSGLVCIAKQVQAFTSLPARAFNGYQVEVTGSPGNAFDNYYLQYADNEGSAQAAGIWKEIPKPGRLIALDPATMPHSLVREADGTFTFKQIDWDKCKAGDEKTIPKPSFVGQRISDIFFFRNRLGFISDENINFSKSAEFFNFFRSSATALLDTDPIDVAVSHVKVSILRHAVPFNESLLLFSDQTQFILGADEVLSPATVSVDQTTEFEASLKAKPVGAGQYVYFCTNKGGFTGVREYYLDGSTKTNSANDVTGHVPRYIEGSVFKLSASTNEDVLIALSDKHRNAIYVYKYYSAGQEKVQSSWSRWEFDPDAHILTAEFIESTLWLVIQRPDGLYLERMDIEDGTADEDMDFIVHLDRRIHEAGCEVTVNGGFTDIVPPWQACPCSEVQIMARAGDAESPAGRALHYTTTVDNQGRTVYRVMGHPTRFYIGLRYALRYVLSPLLVRQEAPGGGQIGTTEGRIQVRRVIMNYADTGYFRVEVTPRGRNTYTSVFTGRIVGSGRNRIGAPALETGGFKFPVMANNLNVEIVLINDTAFPSRILNADWEALYTVRTMKMQ